MIEIKPGRAGLDIWEQILFENANIFTAPEAAKNIRAAYDIVSSAAKGKKSVYGVNTGFGKLARIKINAEDTARLQRNLILSHASGIGLPMPKNITRLMMALKINSLARGASGVSPELIKLLQDMLAQNIIPIVPGQGSVGASGDLAPLAHMALVMIGEGEAYYKGKKMPGAQALKRAGLKPVVLQAKEGLGLINGTQFSTAYALAGYFTAKRIAYSALITGAMSVDAAMGSATPFKAFIHELRGHKGQIKAGRILHKALQGSEILGSHLQNDERVQDPYCLRCQPQLMGACLDILDNVAAVLQTEANAVTDNPLVNIETGEILSGGNFHAEPVAFAADQTALAIAEIGAIAQRRISLLVDPALSFGLPPFLSPNPGLNSGLMIAEVTSAALMSENKHLANPCSTDSTPTSANQEDHVSMAAHASRRLMQMCDNLAGIIAIEYICAAQGIELRAPLKTSPVLQKAIKTLRNRVDFLQNDRIITPDIEMTKQLINSGRLIKSAGKEIFT